MRLVRYAVVAVLSLPLAGCLGLPPKELPPWAMTGPVATAPVWPQYAEQAPRRARTAEAAYWPPVPTREIKPFSPEWQAREDALDSRLRRTMSICGGC